MNDVDAIQKDVEVFVKKCQVLLQYNKAEVIVVEEFMVQFYDIMDSVRNISVPRNIKSEEIKSAAHSLVMYAKKVQQETTLQGSAKQELPQLVLGLAAAMKKTVNEYTQQQRANPTLPPALTSALPPPPFTYGDIRGHRTDFAQTLPVVDV